MVFNIVQLNFFDRFIFVNYNAWHFAGCEFLWAGIIKALAEKVEEEFGVLTTRLFRSISLKTEPEREPQPQPDDKAPRSYRRDNIVLSIVFVCCVGVAIVFPLLAFYTNILSVSAILYRFEQIC